MIDRDPAVVEVLLAPEIVAEAGIDVFPNEGQVLERIDVGAFPNGDPITDDDVLGIQDPIRRKNLCVHAEIGELRLVLIGERLMALQQIVVPLNRRRSYHHAPPPVCPA